MNKDPFDNKPVLVQLLMFCAAVIIIPAFYIVLACEMVWKQMKK